MPVLSAGSSRLGVILALGTTQTLAWASSYYLLAILAGPIAASTGMSANGVFAAFSFSLLISALVGPRVGRTIDRFGGRTVLMLSNAFFAAGLFVMAGASDWVWVWLAWAFMGAGMGFGLYDAAFATLARIYGATARPAITGVTLMGGLASTVGWPLTAWGLAAVGWRETCVIWAFAHLFIGVPLNAMLPRVRGDLPSPANPAPRIEIDRTMILLGFAFAAGWTISTGMAAHLPHLLQDLGATGTQAIAAGMLIGPAQVAARIAEATLFKRAHPLTSARLSAGLHPLGAALLFFGMPGIAIFALLHGAGNGILTIARGTVPLAIYGPENYGYRLGILGVPSRMAQAASPLLFGLLIEALGAGTFVVSAVIMLAALAAFCLVQTEPVKGHGDERG
ncbi:major facilitator superfamily MFS_1 [Rhodomicrobium vannielii ATCC 17100]|uniref:Major facilitator superfamily MFS_1 n=1 Tax=Rhodomicrobium vannielii (strain ATCC 17100 / DSM 162 / LMG 4299 / NCIMB 10020 / ATH 3.1.1) TaxID=648757 RepID=E3I701_RHOVT|nr:major facilitator superfamily MFS_1 [Rhodomicrobium vannielii ATCC 17100]